LRRPRGVGQDLAVDSVVAKRRLMAFQAEASWPGCDVRLCRPVSPSAKDAPDNGTNPVFRRWIGEIPGFRSTPDPVLVALPGIH